MSISNVEEFVKRGFRIREHVVLTKRITVKYGAGEDDRKDVAVGTKVPIKGFVGTEHVVCEFDIATGSKNKAKTVEWKVNADKLVLESNYVPPVSAEKKAKDKFEFLKNETGDDMSVVEKWEDNLIEKDENIANYRLRNLISFTMDSVVKKLPKYTSTDFLVVKRQSQHEVWTLRDFKAGAIMLAPESTEIKPRLWTAGRSAMVKNTTVGVGGRPMVIDGRVRAAPEGKSGFALFWLVTRAYEKDDLKNVNLELKYIESDLKMNMTVDGHVMTIDNDAASMPSFPILINPKKVNKHTRLIAKEDLDMKKLAERLEKEKLKEEKAPKDKGADEDKDAPPQKKAKK